MHLRSVLISFLILLLSAPAALAQKRVSHKVNPNANAFNSSADLYDPQTGGLASTTVGMKVAREQHTAIKLIGGKVLIAGGFNDHYLSSAEIFDPATGLFTDNLKTTHDSTTGRDTTTAGNLNVARSGAGAVQLLDGKVLFAGGFNGSYLTAAETYDPSTGAFSFINSMTMTRNNPTLTLLNSGKVLVTGGFNGSFLSSSEIYDPFAQGFAGSGNMSSGRDGHSATLLSDGRVLVVGGCTNADSSLIYCDKYLNTADIYDPSTGVFTQTGNLNTARAGHTASLLSDGRVLIAGGTDGSSSLASAEIFDPSTGVFTLTGNMGIGRKGHTAATITGGKVLVAGGYSNGYLSSAEVFDPTNGTFKAVSSSMSAPRFQHAATVLDDGRVLLTGGQNSDLLVFDVNIDSSSDNVSPNIVFSSDSSVGFVPYTGSGVVVAFSTTTGAVLNRIVTGGKPAFVTPLLDGKTLAIVSVFDNRIFLVGMDTRSLKATYTFSGAQFGFGSILTLSPDGSLGYVSSTGTGEVIKFDVATGNELKRLNNLLTPAQVTVTPDGSTLLVVDTSSAEVYFVDTSSMSTKYKMSPRTGYANAGFTIFNKPVLRTDGSYGVIGSQDIATSNTNALFVFNTSTGEIIAIEQIGPQPAFTTFTPDNKFWLVLTSSSLAIVPTNDPGSTVNADLAQGTPIGSANIVLSPDLKYAFYAASSGDMVLQHDISTHGIVGAYLVGDDPNVSSDQASSVALSPDAKTLAVLDFASNELDLLIDSTALRGPEYISKQDEFTGVTLINLSNNTANVTLTAIADFGSITTGTDVVNPITLKLKPNEQQSFELGQILNLDNSQDNVGHFAISSDQSAVTGFAVTGKIRSTFLSAFVSNLDGMPLYRFPSQLHDWIVPDIPLENSSSVDLHFTNPNYNTSGYDVTHFSTEGSVLETKTGTTLGGLHRTAQATSSLLTNSPVGTVLIAGGRGSTSLLSAELFVPVSQVFSSTSGYMATPRYGHASVLLRNGNVLLTGGRNGYNFLDSAEIYDAANNRFISITGTMAQNRFRHTATMLANGKVLVAGGQNSVSINGTAELFDPDSNTFSPTAGFMNSARDAHTATLLSDGRVLIAGGIDGISISSTAELYNSLTSLFNTTGNMSVGRAFHAATLLQNGKVLITGGYNGSYLSSAEIFDPSSGTFSAIPSMNVERSNHTSTLLQDGTVLIAGGTNTSGVLASVEVYIPAANRFFLLTRTMTAARTDHTATLLSDERVLIVGGFNGTESLDNSEIYDSKGQTFSQVTGNQVAKRNQTATLLQAASAGYLRIASTIGQMFREQNGASGARTAINGIDVTKYAGITRIFSPKFTTLVITLSPQKITEKTILNVINANTNSEATVTITLHASDGSVLGTPVTKLLAKNAQINDDLLDIFQNDPAIQDKEGWIEVASSVDYVLGTVSFTNSSNTYLTTYELSSTPLSHFVFPLAAEDKTTYQTGITLLNNNNQPATAQMELWNSDGTMYLSTPVSLLPHARVDQFLGNYFPGLPARLTGYIRISSDQPLHSFSVVKDPNPDHTKTKFTCAVPPIAFPE